MNQRCRQKAKRLIEKDFFKLLNKANFGYDNRYNIDNCTFESISNEISEITYRDKYYSLFDKEVSKFVNSNLIKQEIEKTYNEEMLKTEENDPYRNGEFFWKIQERRKNKL